MAALKAELDAALVQLRAAEAQLSRTVAALEAAGVWSGDDATAFQSAWVDEVHRPLVIATVSLEALSFVPMA
jgi:hypothetical protein